MNERVSKKGVQEWERKKCKGESEISERVSRKVVSKKGFKEWVIKEWKNE